jgi:hypothetical protein
MQNARLGVRMRGTYVFPLPVTASTTTSLCARNSGIAAFWTGVILRKPWSVKESRREGGRVEREENRLDILDRKVLKKRNIKK